MAFFRRRRQLDIRLALDPKRFRRWLLRVLVKGKKPLYLRE